MTFVPSRNAAILENKRRIFGIENAVLRLVSRAVRVANKPDQEFSAKLRTPIMGGTA
jgi:hypothetical protein